MSNSPRADIIIPCYWGTTALADMTEDCLASLDAVTSGIKPIIIDDGSPHSYHGKYINWGDWVTRSDNGGYAAAVNTGFWFSEAPIIVISNNDIIFTPGWLEAILKPLEQGYDISSIRTSDNGWDTEDKITEGDKFGSLWAMKREVYETIGGLSEEFGKGYFEDLDYHKRAEAAGFKVGKNHGHLVEHKAKATFSLVDPEDTGYHQAMDRYKAKYGRID